MNKWVQTREGIVGQVVAKVKLEAGLALGVDVSGNGDVWYVAAKDVRGFDITTNTWVPNVA